jgi:glycosyltransferase involved in cell wall biosynthesis
MAATPASIIWSSPCSPGNDQYDGNRSQQNNQEVMQDSTNQTHHAATVSVIIPCYNCANTLQIAVDSVLAQQGISPQIVLVDDGSSDTTPDLMRALQARHPDRIITDFQRNQGPAAARNRAIKSVYSDYIAFLDSDDYWPPDKLRTQLEFMLGHPNIGLTHCAAYKVDAAGHQFQMMQIDSAYGGRCFEKLLEFNGVITSTVCMRRDVVAQCGLFDESLTTRSDWEYWVRVAHDFEFGILPQPLCYIRVHDGNISNRLDQTCADHKKILMLNQARYGGQTAFNKIFDRAWYIFHSRYSIRFAASGRYAAAMREWRGAVRLRPLDLNLHYGTARAIVRTALKQLLASVTGYSR